MPFGLRRDFGEEYLPHLRLVVLAFTETYIDGHFDDIAAHANDAELRLDDGWLTPERLKEDNRLVAGGFSRAGEQVTLINDCYEAEVGAVLEELQETLGRA
jgi:hypothetical protein